MWSSADENSERASEERMASKTRAQHNWDCRSVAVTDIARRLHQLTQAGATWSRNPEKLELVLSLFSDGLREARALSTEGYREGDPAPAMPTLQPIEAKCATALSMKRGA